MNVELLQTMKQDIKRCEEAQVSNEGTQRLYQALIAKYNGIFDNFGKEIPTTGKVSCGGALNYRPELNAIKEKLEVLIIAEKGKNPFSDFITMFEEDLEKLKSVIADCNNCEMEENEKLVLYKDITGKYHAYIPRLSDGLYGFYQQTAIYDDVSGEALFHNLRQVYNKMLSFKALGYPTLKDNAPQSAPIVQITNKNENHNDINISISDIRNRIENMSALKDSEIDEILNKIDELEKIIQSSERKTKKWENAKEIVKWIAEKSVDVGMVLLPLVLKIKE